MSTSGKWKEAAERYRNGGPKKSSTQIEEYARQLGEFLKSDEGAEALDLLKASKRAIVIAEDEEGGAHCGVQFAFAGDGLVQLLIPRGTWAAYDPAEAQKLVADRRELKPFEAVKASCDPKIGKAHGHNFMAWLRRELDKIANTAPIS